MFSPPEKLRIAVLIPCYNEELTIAKVIRDFREQIPNAKIIVFDNNSADNSVEISLNEGADIFYEKNQGKGFVINSMLKYVDADVYVMVDGDDTYPAENVWDLINPILHHEADMVVGQRLSTFEDRAFRPMHLIGNRLVCKLINSIFHSTIQDPMSGYRAFTRDVALNLPVVAYGFDVETEITLQLLYRKFVINEVTISYRERPEGSQSKLRTYRDGFAVIVKILNIFRIYKPLTFFGALSILTFLAGLIFGYFPVQEYIQYQYVYSVPKAILSAGLMAISVILSAIGIILNSLNFRMAELTNIITKQVMFGINKDQMGSYFDRFQNVVDEKV